MPAQRQLSLNAETDIRRRALDLLSQMTLQEKIGQMCQVANYGEPVCPNVANDIRHGWVGSIINEVNLEAVNELQRIAIEESRLGIPLLIGRDVIHGFKTIFPIPLGQAASFCAKTVEMGARIAATEAVTAGVNWTFAPMMDISRDPRWGRVAESFGEDPYLCAELACAMVKGFQTQDLSDPTAIAACAKHFAGYGASESGRDYCTTNIPENELRNVYLPPFKAVADLGVGSFMASFSDLNGVPCSGNQWLMKQILREEWRYEGMLVSDWESISQLSIHGLTESDQESAFEAINAGIDMEMVSNTYRHHAQQLLEQNRISEAQIDEMVLRVLILKFNLGLFENAYIDPKASAILANDEHLAAAKIAAEKSCVLLQNHHNRLPLSASTMTKVAVIGPLADDGYEQLGTWIFDGDASYSVDCLTAIKDKLPDHVQLCFAKGLATSRSHDTSGFAEAVSAAQGADVAIMVMGEESILSGEAHCRAELDLPGAQAQLIEAIAQTKTPIALVIMAGRPLTIESQLPHVDSVLYAWHPGTMGGPAIRDILFGDAAPTAKLPITFPRKVGQIPIYYGQKHSGKPANEHNYVHMDDFPVRAQQTSLGMAATHMDTHYSPLFPFGFGLTYSDFDYTDIKVSKSDLAPNDSLQIEATIRNIGARDAEQTVQLYIRDLHASVTRPVRELKGFKKVHLSAGESRVVSFTLATDALSFFDRYMRRVVEPGRFQAWIGGDSQANLTIEFEIEKPT